MLLLALGGLSALAVAMGVGRFLYTPLLPMMEAGLGLSKSQAGLLASSNFLGYLVGALLAASPLVPGSRRAWMLGGLALSAATTAAMGVADGMTTFLALRFAGGVASAFVLVFCSALVVHRLASNGCAAYTPLHFAGVGTGIALSAVLVSLLAMVAVGWRGMWLASGVLSIGA
ncbi:MAG: YbfB/YjiJ family MFS transporter, partial [Proteobacteria bacterium]